MNRRRLLGAAAAALGGVAGCTTLGGEPGVAERTSAGDGGGAGTAATTATAIAPTTDGVAYTYGPASGNRIAAGRGSLPDADPVDVPLSGTPAWVVGAPVPGGSLWVVALADGRLEAVRLTDEGWTAATLDRDRLPAGAPPVLVHGEGAPGGTGGDDGPSGGDAPRILAPPDGASELTNPVVAGDRVVAVGADGDLLVLRDGAVRARHAVDALPDARPVVMGDRVAVLAGATDRYAHGALGDAVEAGAVAVLDLATGDLRTVETPGATVVEGLAPIWAEWGPGPDPVLVVTLTDADDGARLAALSPAEGAFVTGPAIGTGFRWRHQLAVAPFADEFELAVVRTPHIGGTVEFYRHAGDRLTVTARRPGYSSHAFGSRNLDAARAADADGDGRVELVVPTDDRRRLVGLRRTGGDATAAWHVPVGARATTNLATVTREGALALGVGRADATLRLW